MLRGLREVMRSQLFEESKTKEKEKEKPTIKTKQWASGIKLEQHPQIKMHIYNFFITEGHYDLANTFAKEAKLSVGQIDERSIQKRSKIKNMIKDNQINEAIQQIQQFQKSSGSQKRQEQLIFTLKCLKIINLIKQQKINQAISTAKQQLLPYIKKNFEWMEKVEKVMSLIAFINIKQCQNKDLLSPHYKNNVADEVNTFLLGDNSHNQSLKMLIKFGKWCERKLNIYVNFPHINPWGFDLYK